MTRKLIMLLALFCGGVYATTLTGSLISPLGGLASGTLTITTPTVSATIIQACGGAGGQLVPQQTYIITVSNGTMATFPFILGNDCMNPTQLTYTVRFVDTSNRTFTGNWYISGTTFDVGTAGLGQVGTVQTLPASTQSVNQPNGTSLRINYLDVFGLLGIPHNTTVPTMACDPGDVYARTFAGSVTIYGCDSNGVWRSTGGGGGGAVDSVFGRVGDVDPEAGDYTAALVTNVPAGTIAATQVQAALNELDTEKQATGNYMTALTGDGSASGPGSAALTLTTVNSNVGACGSSTQVCVVTLDAKGRATAATATTIRSAAADGATTGIASFTANDFNATTGNISIDYTNGQAASTTLKGFLTNTDWNTFNGKQAAGNYITALTGDASASGPGSAAITFATVNSNVGACGDATHVCVITVNGKGLVTAATATTISAGSGDAASKVTTTYSATPTFTCNSNTATNFFLTLTGNVSSSTLAGCTTGQLLTFTLIQDGTGGWTFVPPTNVLRMATLPGVASQICSITYVYDGTNAQPLGGMVCSGNGVRIPGATSGATTLLAPATGGGVATFFTGTDTIVGKASTDIFTNKTFDTADTGNVFEINNVAINAVQGNTAKVQLAGAGTPMLGDCAEYDANGNLVPDTCGSGGTPGGADTQVQINDMGAFYGDSGLTYDKTGKVLTNTGDGTGRHLFVLRQNAVDGVCYYAQETAAGPTASVFCNQWYNMDGTGAKQWGFLGASGDIEGYGGYFLWSSDKSWIGPAAPVGLGGGALPTGANIIVRRGDIGVATGSTYMYVVEGPTQSGGGFGGGTPTDAKFRMGLDGVWAELNNETVGGIGTAYVRGTPYNQTGLIAPVASGNLLATAAAGSYRVGTYAQTTTVDGNACTLNVILGWTYNGQAQTKTVVNAMNLNVDETYANDVSIIKVDASSNITRETTSSCTRAAYVYDATMVVERVN